MAIENISSNKSFGGWHKQYTHDSTSVNCNMQFAIFLPPQADLRPVPVLYWLSGLTCTDENFMQKAGALRVAADLGIAIVAPDTSPRGEDVADAEDGAYDLGLGAGFYLNATQAPYKAHYQMYDYIVHELPEIIESNFPVTTKRAISGHSMGGHGALTIGLRNGDKYCSMSAFSPIANPMNSLWGQKVFTHYLGKNREDWYQYDASELLASVDETIPILVDQGESDTFLEQELKPHTLEQAAKAKGHSLTLRMQPGYDHSYYFIASFIEEHLRFHAKHLK